MICGRHLLAVTSLQTLTLLHRLRKIFLKTVTGVLNRHLKEFFSFAQALAGDDEEKMAKNEDAFEKGFKEATKTWGTAVMMKK